ARDRGYLRHCAASERQPRDRCSAQVVEVKVRQVSPLKGLSPRRPEAIFRPRHSARVGKDRDSVSLLLESGVQCQLERCADRNRPPVAFAATGLVLAQTYALTVIVLPRQLQQVALALPGPKSE